MDTKICGLCGQDCSDRPRTKDPRGTYFCQPCYQRALERQRGESIAFDSDAPLPPTEVENDWLADLGAPGPAEASTPVMASPGAVATPQGATGGGIGGFVRGPLGLGLLAFALCALLAIGGLIQQPVVATAGVVMMFLIGTIVGIWTIIDAGRMRGTLFAVLAFLFFPVALFHLATCGNRRLQMMFVGYMLANLLAIPVFAKFVSDSIEESMEQLEQSGAITSVEE